MRDLLANSPVLPPGLKNRFEGVLIGSQTGWWTTVLGAKDAGLAIGIAHGGGFELPSSEVVRRRYEQAASSGLHDADIAAVTELYRSPTTDESHVAAPYPLHAG